MKKICFIITGLSFTFLGFTQTGQHQVENQTKDEQRKADAAKADVIITRNKNIFDSTTFNNDTYEATINNTVKASAKRKHCGDKRKQGSNSGALKKKA